MAVWEPQQALGVCADADGPALRAWGHWEHPEWQRATATARLTRHSEVLSIDDVVLNVKEVLLPVVVSTAVKVLQVGHHSHAAPPVLAVRAWWDGHQLLSQRVLLPEPATEAST